jgi:hypothetical protein
MFPIVEHKNLVLTHILKPMWGDIPLILINQNQTMIRIASTLGISGYIKYNNSSKIGIDLT